MPFEDEFDPIETEEYVVGPRGLQGVTGATGAGLPTGGTTGQVAAKLSDDPLDIGWVNAGAGDVLSTDPRLEDARTPTAHKSTHATGGGDALTPGDIGAATTAALTSEASTRAAADTALQSAIDLKADLVGGVVPSAQIPAIAITDYLGSVASQAAMLALTGQKGDWALRSDLGTTWVIVGSDPTQLSSWQQLSYPTAPVTSVNSQTGAVVLGKADVGLASANDTSDADKPVSTAQAAALALKAPLASPTLTGTPLAPTASPGTNTTQLATTAFVTSAIAAAPAGGLTIYCTVEDQKTLGTHGGNHVSGSDQERTLNTVVTNNSGEADNVLLNNSAVLLKAGNWYFVIGDPVMSLTDTVVSRIKTTGGTKLLESGPDYVSNSIGINKHVWVFGAINVPAGADVSIKLYTQSESTVNTVGRGNAIGSVLGMPVERYAVVNILRAPIPA